MNRIRGWIARLVLRLGHLIDPEAEDDLIRIQRYNENLNTELQRERDKRTALNRVIREKDRKITELEAALEARKEALN